MYSFSISLLSEARSLLVLRFYLHSPPASLAALSLGLLSAPGAESTGPVCLTPSHNPFCPWAKGLQPQCLEELSLCSSHLESISPFSLPSAL